MIKLQEDILTMTDFERRIKTRLIEDEYAEKFHRLDTEETIAHINRDNQELCRINEKRVQLEAEMEVEKNLLRY
ncbi:hypothetical protein D7V94_22010 [Parablautia intestinalis]|uniref:Uncharacterized protein n=2 Tax=Parablautia intestinalis TaxID=2320100 RepID=A0A3A9A6B0_9FIRM|nr:hypothetical protein D7V94_22010 [Parablautia intestinalis]